MKRPSGGTQAMVAAGLIVAAAAVWAQWRLVEESSPAPELRIAVIVRTEVGETSRSALVVRTLPDHGARTVRSGPSGLVEPTWSPDGSKLAFVELDREGEDVRLVIWDYETGRETSHTLPPLVGASGLWWTQDSKAVVVPGTTTVAFSRTGTTLFSESSRDNVDRFTPLQSPTEWSPDGQQLAFRRGDRLAIYDPRNGIREYEASDFGLTGTFEGYSVLVRQPASPAEPGWLYVVATRIERDPQAFVWLLDLGTRSAKQLGGGEVFAKLFFPADTEDLIEQARSTHAEVGPIGFTADGRGRFVTYHDSAPAAPSGSRETGLLLETRSKRLDLSLGELVGGRPRGDFDVVLVGDWPTP